MKVAINFLSIAAVLVGALLIGSVMGAKVGIGIGLIGWASISQV